MVDFGEQEMFVGKLTGMERKVVGMRPSNGLFSVDALKGFRRGRIVSTLASRVKANHRRIFTLIPTFRDKIRSKTNQPDPLSSRPVRPFSRRQE